MFIPLELRIRMRVAALLALCAAADGLQAGFTPLPATAASVAARAPVVLAQENSPFAKLANVPAPALVASFSGAGLVVVVRVPRRTHCMRLPFSHVPPAPRQAALVSSTAGPPDAAPYAVVAIGLLKLGQVLLGEE